MRKRLNGSDQWVCVCEGTQINLVDLLGYELWMEWEVMGDI